MTEHKLAVISDFHLDANLFDAADLDKFDQVLQEEKITDLHFAGDMSNDFHALTLPFFEQLSNKYDLTFNLGNHDMLGLSEEEIDKTDFTVKSLGSKTLLAFHGWYDYSFYQGDKSKILHFKNNFYFDRKIRRPLDDVATTEQILARLNHILSRINGEVLVIMHFVPDYHFIFPNYYEKFARFNAFLGSQKFHDLFKKYPNVTDVVFGHVHHRFPSRKIDGITYHARPLGYTYDWEMIDGFLEEFPERQTPDAYRLKKRYLAIKNLPEWREFRVANLMTEFRSAMTVFEY
ncbi:metallophosphoesterase [Lactovum odontotermitis]